MKRHANQPGNIKSLARSAVIFLLTCLLSSGYGCAEKDAGNGVSDNRKSRQDPSSPAALSTSANNSGNAKYRLSLSSYLDGRSGNYWEMSRDVAVDTDGNIYITGGTSSADFPVTAGAYDTTYNQGGSSSGTLGGSDAFVMKLDPAGNILWSTYLGGPNYDRSYAIEVDNEGYVYVAGRAGEDFPTTPGVIQADFAGDNTDNSGYGKQDGFIAKLSPDGKELVWSTYFGEAGEGVIRDIDLDQDGIIYVAATGITSSLEHITPNAHRDSIKGSRDGAYAKVSNDGHTLLYGTYLGGNEQHGESDVGNPSIRVDSLGYAYIAAFSAAPDIPVAGTALQPAIAGKTDAILFKFTPNDEFLPCTYYGGSGVEYMETHQLAIDKWNNMVITGFTRSPDLKQANTAYQYEFGGEGDAYIAKISNDCTRLVASTYLGGTNKEMIEGVDTAGNNDDMIYVAGGVSSNDFPLSLHPLQDELKGKRDGFISVFDKNLSRLLYSTYIGGDKADSLRCIAVGTMGEIIAGGNTNSSHYPLMNEIDNSLNGTFGATVLLLRPDE